MPRSKPSQRRSRSTSSIMSSSRQFAQLMKGQLILTIRYICPHCSEVHFLDFPLSWSMNTKTLTRLTMRCSISSRKIGSVQWATHGKAFMVLGEPFKAEWISGSKSSQCENKSSLSASDAQKLLSKLLDSGHRNSSGSKKEESTKSSKPSRHRKSQTKPR